MKDRRRYLRTPIDGEVEVRHGQRGTVVASLRDVSDGGVFVLTGGRLALAVGDKVSLQARELEDAPRLAARVVRVELDGVALLFCDE